MLTSTESVKEYLDTAYRYRWWVGVPLALSLVSGFALVRLLPETYRASTTILVVRQTMPEDIVRSTVTTGVEDRMASLAVQVLSRKYLEKIVLELDIVPQDASADEIELASKRLHGSVRVNFDRRRGSYFEIIVQDRVPERTAAVANRLAELFIEQNTALRQQEATSTLRQVEHWLEQNRAELELEEKRIADYRRERIWELPERLETNIALLQAAQAQLDTVVSEIQGRSEQLDALRDRAEGNAVAPADEPSIDPNLSRLNAELAGLLRTRTEVHPSVKAKLRELDEYRRIAPALTTEIDANAESGIAAADAAIVRAETEAVRREITGLESQRERLLAQIEMYQGRIDRTPLSEQELNSLSRELDVLQVAHNELLETKETAVQAREMEMAKQGEHFQVQDFARVPGRPFKPNPPMILAANVIGALVLGIGFAFVSELLGQTIRTEVEFRRIYRKVPLLICIPHFEEPRKRRRRRLRRFGRSAAAMWLALVLSIGMLLW